MKGTEQGTVHALEIGTTQAISNIEACFLGRGLAKAAWQEAEAQEMRERETEAMEPNSYRLSHLSEGAINGQYRRGLAVMNTSGLLSYFADTRALRMAESDFSQMPPSDNEVYAGEAEKALCLSVRGSEEIGISEKLASLPAKVCAAPKRVIETVKASKDMWFNSASPDTAGEKRRFPLSAFAAIIAVAMSLLLIVASSVMIHAGESRVNGLNLELSSLTSDVNEIRSDLDIQTDLLTIRQVAVEEYGMVGEEYVRMGYLLQEEEDSIEVYATDEENNVGLGALLSALGLR